VSQDLGDPAGFTRALEARVSRWTRAQASAFAARVAERHRDDLRDHLDERMQNVSAREIVDALASGPLSAATADAFSGELRRLAELVDPDRFAAFEVLRGIRVLEAAVGCCAGACGPLEVALAALAARAMIPVPRPEDVAQLGRAWAWSSVAGEAGWLLATADDLAAAPPITLPVAGSSLRLRCAGGSRYSAEVDGEPRPIRWRLTLGTASEGGGLGWRDPPPWAQSTTAELAPLVECLAEGARPVERDGATVLQASVPSGHDRQNRFTRVAVTLAADGAVEIDMRVATQDESDS
jgi:hypothetical protein